MDDNTKCKCFHPLRDHKPRHGQIAGICLLAGCWCNQFREAPVEEETPSTQLSVADHA